ncbi:hypothetical protein EMCRGX_G014587 [Ephydatia muelleri]
MPLIVKRKGELLTTESKRHKADSGAPGTSKKHYESLQRLSYVQDEWHTLVRIIPSSVEELRKVVAKYVGSFLNGNGGILVFGVSRTGFVYGDTINRKEEDNLRLTIDETFKKFKPMVRPDMYRITFTLVKEREGSSRDDLQVVEIRVATGDRHELYQDEFHESFLRRGSDAHGPLTPHEIKMHTLKQCTQKLIAEKRFVDLLHVKEDSNKTKGIGNSMKEENNGVEVGGKGTERNNNSVNSQPRQQKADMESEKERKDATPVIRYGVESDNETALGSRGGCKNGLSKETAIEVDRLDKANGEVMQHSTIAAKPGCLSEGVALASTTHMLDSNREAGRNATVGSESRQASLTAREGGPDSTKTVNRSAISSSFVTSASLVGGSQIDHAPSRPRQGITSSVKVSPTTVPDTTSSLKVSPTTVQGTTTIVPGTTSSLKVSPTTAQGTTSSLKVSPTTVPGTTSSLKVSPTTVQGTTSSLKVTPTTVPGTTSSLKVSPTTANDGGLTLDRVDTAKSGVQLVKIVYDMDKENRNICPTTSRGLTITVAAAKPYGTHQVVSSASQQQQPGTRQAAPWLNQQPGTGTHQAAPWLAQQPGTAPIKLHPGWLSSLALAHTKLHPG